ncbi:hypothetical protein C7A12_16805 [Pseudomonas fluorescens]|nr:hypothetical protein C7A12_16805 [Pseudomonas fluorescens]PRW77145.1 hypothetical protein C7A13_16415 [Pseudomonas fluorescens]PRW90149.1 hypothetical protein C7A11_05285 [Pseudomonas simiae]TKK07976.1 hypothetical protein PflCFBP13514_05855 [Pseudomonas fluorescens]
MARAIADPRPFLTPCVGASLLAKIVNDNAVTLVDRGALRFFASKLAPTVGGAGAFSGAGRIGR